MKKTGRVGGWNSENEEEGARGSREKMKKEDKQTCTGRGESIRTQSFFIVTTRDIEVWCGKLGIRQTEEVNRNIMMKRTREVGRKGRG